MPPANGPRSRTAHQHHGKHQTRMVLFTRINVCQLKREQQQDTVAMMRTWECLDRYLFDTTTPYALLLLPLPPTATITTETF